MPGIIGQVARNTSIYGFANIMSRVIGFLMIPVYTRILSPADYGVVEMIDLTGAVVCMWVGFSISNAIVRFYHDYEEEPQRRELVSTALIFVTATSLAASLALLPFSGWFSDLLFGNRERGGLFALLFASLFFQLLVDNCLVYLQVRQQAALYAACSLARLALGLALNIVLVVFMGMGVAGIILSGLVTSAAVGAALAARTFSATGFRFSPGKLRMMIAYGFPLIFSSLSTFVITFSDRYFLNAYSTLSEVGIYSLGYKIAMLVSFLITNPFLTTWSAKRFEIARRPDADWICSRVFTYFSLVIASASLALIAFSRDVLRVMADPAFAAAAGIVPMVVAGYVFNGFYYHFSFGIFLKRRTKVVAAIMASAALLNLLLNHALIPGLHGMGAALATTLTYLYIACTTFLISQRMHPIPYEAGRVGAMLLLAAALSGASLLLRFESIALSAAAAAGLVALFPAILLLSGFFRRDELDWARGALSWLRGRLPRGRRRGAGGRGAAPGGGYGGALEAAPMRKNKIVS